MDLFQELVRETISSLSEDIAICKLEEGIDCRNIHSNDVTKIDIVFRELLCIMFNYFLNHNYIPKKMLYGEIRPRMKDNTVRKTKIENCRSVIRSPLIMKVFEYMILPSLTNNLKLYNL